MDLNKTPGETIPCDETGDGTTIPWSVSIDPVPSSGPSESPRQRTAEGPLDHSIMIQVPPVLTRSPVDSAWDSIEISEEGSVETEEDSVTENKQSPHNSWSHKGLRSMDVICARGSNYHKHPGNRRYLGIIKKLQESYQAAKQKAAKTELTRMVIQQVKENGSRFVEYNKKSKAWSELGSRAEREKVSHALRGGSCTARQRRKNQYQWKKKEEKRIKLRRIEAAAAAAAVGPPLKPYTNNLINDSPARVPPQRCDGSRFINRPTSATLRESGVHSVFQRQQQLYEDMIMDPAEYAQLDTAPVMAAVEYGKHFSSICPRKSGTSHDCATGGNVVSSSAEQSSMTENQSSEENCHLSPLHVPPFRVSWTDDEWTDKLEDVFSQQFSNHEDEDVPMTFWNFVADTLSLDHENNHDDEYGGTSSLLMDGQQVFPLPIESTIGNAQTGETRICSTASKNLSLVVSGDLEDDNDIPPHLDRSSLFRATSSGLVSWVDSS